MTREWALEQAIRRVAERYAPLNWRYFLRGCIGGSLMGAHAYRCICHEFRRIVAEAA